MFTDLKNKKALITGASSGIGAGIAKELAKQGCQLAIHWNSNEAGAKESQQIAEKLGVQAVTFQANLNSESEASELFEQVTEQLGQIDILINNAGIVFKNKILDTSSEDWENVLNTNLKAPFLLSKCFAKNLLDQKKTGCIINVSSVHATRSTELMAAYGSSKAALENFTRIAAYEWGPNIRVNAIAPGFTKIERNEKFLDQNEAEILKFIPLDRYGTPEDIGKLAVFLASDAASWLTGQSIVLDGGTSTRMFFPARDNDCGT